MNAVDLFCGVGGLSLGFEQEGVNVVAAFDFDKRHVETYKLNFPNVAAHCVDISTLNEELLIDFVGSSPKIDIVFGGPPCQGFSVGGKNDPNDGRNSLIFSFLDVIEILKPKIFLMENVNGILSKTHKNTIALFKAKAKKIGYIMSDYPLVLNARDFGVPQNRKRVFFVASLESEFEIAPQAKIANDGVPNPTVKDAIFDLNKIKTESLNSDRYFGKLIGQSRYVTHINSQFDRPKNQQTKLGSNGIGGFSLTTHNEDVIDRFNNTEPGNREPVSLFMRLKWDGIAPTLRAGTTRARGQFMAARPIHPEKPRCITVREAARLHSFPDWFEFYNTKWYGQMQIGNSVPPLLAQAVAREVTKIF